MDQPVFIIALAVGIFLILLLIILLIKQNKPESFGQRRTRTSSAMGRGIAIGIAIGMGSGVAMGTAMDNVALGIAIGAGVGTSIGVAIGQSLQKKEEENRNLQKHPGQQNIQIRRSKTQVIIAYMILLIGFLALGIIMFFNLK